MNTNSAISDLPAAYRAAVWDANRDTWGMPGSPCRGYYELTVYVPEYRPGLLDRYHSAAARHNCGVMAYVAGGDVACDAGFDLFMPETQVVSPRGGWNSAVLLNHRIKCCMRRVEPGAKVRLDHEAGKLVLRARPVGRMVGYYLYPRSSMATKTPLRLANSVGVIDAGYRGEIQAVVDVAAGCKTPFTAVEGLRLVQICPPSLSDPIYARVTTDESLLGSTVRGAEGFGSTGSVGAKQRGGSTSPTGSPCEQDVEHTRR